jgi:hypothetical protein
MTDKPSKNEDEYFALREAEILKARREAADQAAREGARHSHFMKCPRCGADLKAEEHHGIQVERCPECHGVWFDAGEAEAVLRAEPSGLGTVLTALIRGVRSSGKISKPA